MSDPTTQPTNAPVTAEAPVSQTTAPPAPLPSAGVAQPRLRLGWYWLLPLLTALIVAVVLGLAWSRSGVTITLRFTEGHGLKPGDAVRCRGIIIGEVRKVQLDRDTGDVVVQAVLYREAGDVARAGSQFWIARPQADLATGIRGLDTVVGAKYIHVVPGEGEPQREFVGLEAPPIPETIEKGGLEVVLQAHRLAGVRPGAPVTFRQVRVGSVLRVGLASDASAVDIHTYIRPAYARLVRDNTEFWNTSGVRFDAGLRKGIAFSMESAESVLLGGVSLATPSPPGKAVVSGYRKRMATEEAKEWHMWKPSLPLTDARLPEKAIMPRPVRATLEHEAPGRLWGARNYPPRRGLVVPVGRDLLGPSDLLTVPENGKGELRLDAQPPTALKVAPTATTLSAWQQTPSISRLPSALPRAQGRAPVLRVPTAPEECLLVGPTDQEPRAVAVARLTPVGGRWEIDPELLRDTRPQERRGQWHGAAVVAVKDGAVIGLLLVPEGRKPGPYVLPLDETAATAPSVAGKVRP